MRYLEVEKRIYERLGPHPRICRFLYSVEDGVVLERLGNNL
jgi:hypothetical protein